MLGSLWKFWNRASLKSSTHFCIIWRSRYIYILHQPLPATIASWVAGGRSKIWFDIDTYLRTLNNNYVFFSGIFIAVSVVIQEVETWLSCGTTWNHWSKLMFGLKYIGLFVIHCHSITFPDAQNHGTGIFKPTNIFIHFLCEPFM